MSNKKNIEDQTVSILRELNIITPPVPIEKVVSSNGVQIKPYDFGDDVSGALFVDQGISVIGYNPFEPPVRQRFTIAHEFGHLVLHQKQTKSKLFVDKKILYRNKDSSTGEMKQEREANTFAAAILMPAFMIYEEVKRRGLQFIDEQSIKELSDTFKVSQQAMTIRLTNLDMLW